MKGCSTWERTALLASFFLLAFLFQLTTYADYDLWWHLALGRELVESLRIYSTDNFSYTFSGVNQYSSEWLSDFVLYLAHASGGLVGLYIVKAMVILLTFWFLYLVIRDLLEDSHTVLLSAIITLIITLIAIRFRFFIRPYIFSYLFLMIYIFALGRYEKTLNLKTLYCLPVVQLFWSNMSSVSIFGPMVFTFYLVEILIRRDRHKEIKSLLPIFCAVILTSLISPESYHIYITIFQAAIDKTIGHIGEFQPLSTSILWGYGFSYTFGYQLLVIGALIYFFFCGGWRRTFHIFVFLIFFVESIQYVRMIDFFSLTAAPFFALAIEPLLRRIPDNITFQKTITISLTILILTLIPISTYNNKIYEFGIGIKEDTFPDKALEFLDRENITGTMLNSQAFGGYLSWFAPERKVFIDGRYPRVYPPTFYLNYKNLLKDAKIWQEMETQWNFDYALLEYDTKSRQFPLHLGDNPDWALVYWDNIATVYLKRTIRNLSVIERYEYKIARPTFHDFSYIFHRFSTAPADKAFIDQIEKEIRHNPEIQEPRLVKVLALYSLGSRYYEAMYQELKKTLELKPDMAMEHSAIALLYSLAGRKNEAIKEINNALAIDPKDIQALELKKRLGID